MTRPVRVLIVEDRPEDAALMLHELREAGFEPDWVRVDTEEGFLRGLGSGADVILSDHSMPTFDSFRAIWLLKERGLDVPLIVVTGSVDEETAAECIKLGAADYLLKDRLGRLGHSVERALEQRSLREAQRRSQRALRDSEARLRRLTENAQDIIYRYRYLPTPGFEYVNPAAEAITGYTPEEHYADPELGLKLVHPDDRHVVERTLREADGPQALTLRWIRKDGRVIWTEQRNVTTRDRAGNVVAVEGIARDVTDRIEAQEALREAERRYRELFENAIEGIFVTTVEGRCLAANPALASILGYPSPEDLVATGNTADIYADPADRERFLQAMDAHGLVRGFEYRVRRTDGSVIWASENVRAVRDAEGRVVAFEGTVVDVTDRRNAEEALRRRDAALEAVAFAAERLLRARSWEEAIEEILEQLGTATEVDRVDVFRNSVGEDGELLAGETYSWTRPGAPIGDRGGLGPRPYRASGFQRWQDALGRGEEICGHVAGFPEGERAVLTGLGIASTLVVPIFVGQEWWGNLGFHTGTERESTQAEKDSLRTVANGLGVAMLRQRTQGALAESLSALRTSDEQRRRLLSRLIAAQEEERQQIANDIHDDSIQVMVAASLRLAALEASLVDEEQLERLRTLRTTVGQAVERLRHLLFNLRPPALDEEGLEAALRENLQRVAPEAGFAFGIDSRLEEEPDPDTRVILFRLAQEAIVNARKHARASNVVVSLARERDAIVMRITDDGVGFDPGGAEPSGHLGLTSMRERAAMAGGSCSIRSAPGEGTTVEFELPATGAT